MNGEYVCELVRAHYSGDTERFDTIVVQIANSEMIGGNHAVGERLLDMWLTS